MRAAVVVVVASLAFTAASLAGWRPTGSGTGSAKAKSLSTSTGAKPSGSVSSHDVTVSWAASTFAGGGAVPAYQIRRYDLLGNPQTVGAACAGTVSGLSCVESGVPTGTWQYTVTPAAGSWRGSEGPKSDNVVITL
jgi:hypothetical protein